MELNKQIITGFFLVFVILGVALTLSEFLRHEHQSEEGKLITYACEDIKAHEVLRAVSDFEDLTEAIYSHVHSYRNESDTVLAQAIMEIRQLQEESEFSNEDIPMYHKMFSDILNRLSYLELQDAIYFTEHQELVKARGAIRMAQHYLHDAVTLSKNPNIQAEYRLMNEINRLSDHKPIADDLRKGLEEVKRII